MKNYVGAVLKNPVVWDKAKAFLDTFNNPNINYTDAVPIRFPLHDIIQKGTLNRVTQDDAGKVISIRIAIPIRGGTIIYTIKNVFGTPTIDEYEVKMK